MPALLVAACACYFHLREQALEARLAAALQGAVAPPPPGTVPSTGLSPELGAAVDPRRLLYQARELEFALVSDLDKASRDPKRFSWHSLVQHGVLRFDPAGAEGGRWWVEWRGVDRLESKIAVKNRSLELSEVVRFNGELLAVCDVTGLVYRIDLKRKQAYQRWALADGDGDNTKPFKAEWATVKDGALLVGSMGREWYREDGSIENFNNQWVKHIDAAGGMRSINWRPVYEALRTATGTTSPGYLWHEAVEWDPRHRRWLILPRKASEHEPFDDEKDEKRATNVLLLASEDFSSIEVRHVGPLEPEWGFTALRKVPGTDATFLALKAREVAGQTATRIVLFELQGPGGEPRLLLEPAAQPIGGGEGAAATAKFEGLEFLHDA